MLSDTQVEHYSRQIILPGVGGRGQEQLLAASIALVGRGPAADAAAMYLAAAGVGHLVLLGDHDATSVAALSALNADCHVVSMAPTADRLRAIADRSDLVLGTQLDSATQPTLNAECLRAHRPLIWAEVDGCTGHVSTLCDGRTNTPCLACMRVPLCLQQRDDCDCDAFTDLAAAFVGSQQATEAITRLLGLGVTLAGRLLTYDALDGSVTEVAITRDPTCTACGVRPVGPAPEVTA